MSYLKKILTARVYDVACQTPLDEAVSLSQRLGNRVLLKREDLQPVFSFKLRGAYNKLANLDEDARSKGVVAASAGNHAQGVALAAQRLGIHATIVMPATTPEIKINAVAQRGAEVALHGITFDEACRHAKALAKRHGYTFVHPYNDPEVIAGQGTVGLELLQQEGGLDYVFVPVGGGGLLAGVAAAICELNPTTRVIGVESKESACLHKALEAGRRVALPRVGLFADGVAVAKIGSETFRIIRRYVDEVVTVDDDEICAAIKDIFGETRAIAEPAGALALAGLKQYAENHGLVGKQMAAIVSGANVNFHTLRYVSERCELGEKREAIFAVTIPERPGSFSKFCADLGSRNLTEFNYRYAHHRDARIFVGVRIKDRADHQQLLAHLLRKGYPLCDLTDNEVAKLHVRYMVGGHAPPLQHERLYRFEFPERPGALRHFLSCLAGRWNISAFHYRNHDSAHGRVLAALVVPPRDMDAFESFLEQLNYHYVCETENPAYRMFLGASEKELAMCS